MADKVVIKCWCGKILIEGVKVKGEYIPFGFINCPTHTCWYNSEEEYNEHLAKVFARADTPHHTGWGSVVF